MYEVLSDIFWYTEKIFHGLFPELYGSLYVHPLFILCLFGVVGVLVDVDHLVSRYFKMSRPFHIPVLFIIWVCVFCYGAHLFGLF